MQHAWRLAGVASVLAFVVALGFLLNQEAADVGTEAPLTGGPAGIQAGDEWMGLYFKGHKVGLMHLRKTRREAAGGDAGAGWRFDLRTYFRLSVMRQQTALDVQVQADLDDALTLERFEFSVDSGPAKLGGGGVVEGKQMTLTLDSGGGTTTRKIELKRPPVIRAALGPMLALQDLSPGKTLRFSVFDPLTQGDQEVEIEVVGPDTLAVMGEEVPVTHVRQRIAGLELEGWYNARGEAMKQTLSLGLVALRESEAEARWGLVDTGGGPDLVAATMIAPTGLQLPEELVDVRRLELRATDVSLADFKSLPAAGRQTVTGDRIVITREPVGAGAPLPVPADGEHAEHLREEPLVQVGHRAIVGVAQRAIGDATDTVTAARRIKDFVYKTLEKKNVVGVPSALETLQSRVGDCNEHSTLFAAMARSVGIPTRLAVGIVAIEGRFGYHAWNEIWTADGWLSVDSTWDQMPADVGHVRFVLGGLSQQVEMLRVIGKLGLEVTGIER